jgi:hypothetical protein
MADQPEISEDIEAVVAAASAAYLAGERNTYQSLERGPTLISSMSPTWASRAEKLVRRGEREGGAPVARALAKQARKGAR